MTLLRSRCSNQKHFSRVLFFLWQKTVHHERQQSLDQFYWNAVSMWFTPELLFVNSARCLIKSALVTLSKFFFLKVTVSLRQWLIDWLIISLNSQMTPLCDKRRKAWSKCQFSGINRFWYLCRNTKITWLRNRKVNLSL